MDVRHRERGIELGGFAKTRNRLRPALCLAVEQAEPIEDLLGLPGTLLQRPFEQGHALLGLALPGKQPAKLLEAPHVVRRQGKHAFEFAARAPNVALLLMRVGQHQVQARFVRELLEGVAQRQPGLGETPQRGIRPHQSVDGGDVVRLFFDQRLGDGQRILLAPGLDEVLRMLQAVAVAGDERHAPPQLRIQPLHGWRGLPPCQRDARVLLPAQGAIGAAKQAVQARVRLLGVEWLQECHRLVEASGGQQQVRQADDGRRTGAKFLGAPVGGLRFLRTLALAQPLAAPQPCRNVAVVERERHVQRLQRRIVVRRGAR